MLLLKSYICVQNVPASSCSQIQQRKLKTKERRKKRQTRRSLTKLHGGEVIIHQHPHLLKSSQLPAPFQNQGDGCTRQIPPTLLSGWLPPTARGATHHRPLPGQHIISDLHWRRWTGMRRGWPHERWAWLPLWTGTKLFSRGNLSLCAWVCVRVCVREREREREDGGYVKRTCVRMSHQPVSQCVDVTLMQMTSVDSYWWKKKTSVTGTWATMSLRRHPARHFHLLPACYELFPKYITGGALLERTFKVEVWIQINTPPAPPCLLSLQSSVKILQVEERPSMLH